MDDKTKLSQNNIPLGHAPIGQDVLLVAIHGGRGLRHRLAEMGLAPGVRFRILKKHKPGPYIISVRGSRLMLGRGMTERVMVKLLPAGDKQAGI